MPAFETLAAPATLGAISDTHITTPGRRLPAPLLEALRACDYILHAGDICVPEVLDQLAEIAPVFAVRGNNDRPDLAASLPLEYVFRIGAVRLGLLHGHGERRGARDAALNRMRGQVACVVYGHSHRPEVASCDGLLLVNPGSPTVPRFGRAPTFAIVRVDQRVDAQVVDLG